MKAYHSYSIRFIGRMLLGPLLLFVASNSSLAEKAGNLVEPDKIQVPEPAGLKEIRDRIAQGHYSDAEEEARKLLAELEASTGPDSLPVAEVLDTLVEALWRGGKANEPETRALAERALNIKNDSLGADHPELAVTLEMLGNLLHRNDQLEEAKPYFERAMEIQIEAFGPIHPYVASIQNNLANLYIDMAQYSEAKSLFEKALASTEMAHGDEHPALSPMLYNLARLLRRMGDFQGAAEYFERARGITEIHFGSEHIRLAWILNGLAPVYDDLGNYTQAQILYQKTLQIAEKGLGAGHPFVASSLNNLGLLYRHVGEYSEARDHFERALTIIKKARGPGHTTMASILKNLGEILYLIGDFQEARTLYERSLQIRLEAFGPEHPEVATSHYHLADLLFSTGDPAGAKVHYEAAMAIWKASLEPKHPELAQGMHGLATLLHSEGNYEEAIPLLRNALEMRRESLGKDHPDAAETANHLGILLAEIGHYQESRQLLQESLRIREASLGPKHPDYAKSLLGLAELFFRTGETEAAFENALRAEAVSRNHLVLTASSLAEREALRYASVRASGLDLAITLSVENPRPESIGKVWDSLIRSRALILDEMAFRHRAIAVAQDPGTEEIARELAAVKRRLAYLTVRGPDPEFREKHQELLEEARREKEQLERFLARDRSVQHGNLDRHRVGLDQVARQLPRGTGLVAYARYNRYSNPTASGSGSNPDLKHQPEVGPGKYLTFEPHYLALVLRPDSKDPLQYSLGPAEEIDGLVFRWKKEIARGSADPGDTDGKLLNDYREAGEELRTRIWDPITPELEDLERVFLIPDGSLHLVSFATLPVDLDRYLVEKDLILHLLSAERDLVISEPGIRVGEGLLVVGGPDYDANPRMASILQENPTGDQNQQKALGSTEAIRGNRVVCGDFSSIRFNQLSGAFLEAEEIAKVWRKANLAPGTRKTLEDGTSARSPESLTKLVGSHASEQEFKKAAPGKRVIHLATHGFFLGDNCFDNPESSRGIGGLTPASGSQNRPLPPSNPLLLGGLAMAGANLRNLSGPLEEDGILTAEEVTSLNLIGVEWTVLSACDTGVGQLHAGEGILGLRRAFQIAGVKTLIMSLWPVQDEFARKYMRILYENRFLKGMDTPDALQETTLRLLKDHRQISSNIHPFFWGGFVAAGRWD